MKVINKFLTPILIILLLLITGCAGTSSANKKSNIGNDIALEETSDDVVIFAAAIYPPYYYFNSKKEIVGRNATILRKMAENIGIKIVFKCLPWKECLEKGKKGLFNGVIEMSKNRTRELYFNFPRVNLNLVEWSLFASPYYRGRPVLSLNDLRGKKVGIIKDYFYSEEFKRYKGCKKIVANSLPELMQWLLEGKVDFAIEDLKVGNYTINYLKKKPQYSSSSKVEVMPFIIALDPTYITIPKKSENSKELFEKIDNELLRMQNNGELFRLTQEFNQQYDL